MMYEDHFNSVCCASCIYACVLKNSGSQTYSFIETETPDNIAERWRPHFERLDTGRDIPLRSFRIVSEGSPFDGEILTFFGRLHIYIGEEIENIYMDISCGRRLSTIPFHLMWRYPRLTADLPLTICGSLDIGAPHKDIMSL